METPETPEVVAAAAAAGGDDTARRRRRRVRLLLALNFALLLLLLQLTASVVRSPGQGLSAITSAFAGLVADAGEDFVITGTVTAFPACADPAALLPGLDRCLVYTVRNPRTAPITVTSISIADVAGPPACLGDHLDVTRSAFTGALDVPSGATITVPGRPIALRDEAASQDGCRGATFTFTFTGSARSAAAAP
jgi:hypothetical protein